MEKNFELDQITCPLCKDEKYEKIFTGSDRLVKREGSFTVVQCESCGLRYTNPRPTRETMGYFYPDDYAPYSGFIFEYVEMYLPEENLSARIKNEIKWQILKYYYNYSGLQPRYRFQCFDKFPGVSKKLILKIFYRYFLKNYYRVPSWQNEGRALDIGCGNGAFLLLLKKLGWDVMGVDISDNVAQEVKAAGIPIFTGELERLKKEQGTFKLITLWHVLEHFPSPLETLQEVFELLTDNGIVIIEVPNSNSFMAKVFRPNWFPWDLPRHLCHFTPATLSDLLRRAGFSGITLRFLPKNNVWRTLTYWLEDKEIGYDISRLEKNKFFAFIVNFFGRVSILFKTSDTIFLTARKNKLL